MNRLSKHLRAHVLPLVCAMLLAACGGRVELMGAVPEDEANEVYSALLYAGVNAEKTPGKEGMVSLSVSDSQVARALDVLREKGLPRSRFMGMGEVFKKEGLISSPVEERARYLFALSQELESTLSKIDGVAVARVHVVLPERTSTGEQGALATAAIFMKVQEGYNLEPLQPQIRRLVTNAIPALAAERVSVVLVPAQPRTAAKSTFANVLGFDVSPAAAGGLRVLLIGLSLAALLALAGGGFLLWRYVLPRYPKLRFPTRKAAVSDTGAEPQ
jgi:type III secretion protein J